MRDLIAVFAISSVVILIQAGSGAYRADFSADEDEAAHVVSSLMIHDYIAEGFPASPMAYAEAYYVHYPKVAIGHYPPLFHTAEALWMFAFGRNRTALLSLVGLTAVVLVLSVFFWVRAQWGSIPAYFSTLMLLCPFVVQQYLHSVSPNLQLALLSFWAAAVYGRYLATGRRIYVGMFVCLAIACCATHGRGLAILGLPILAAVLRRPFFLTPLRCAGIVAILVVPPSVAFLSRQVAQFTLSRALDRVGDFAIGTVVVFSLPLVLLAIIGAVVAIRDSRRQPEPLAFTAAWISTCVFLVVVPVPFADYYLIGVAAIVAVLAGLGLHLTKALPKYPWGQAAVGAVALGAVVLNFLPPVVTPDSGVGRWFDSKPPGLEDSLVTLVAGDAVLEGAYISEMAIRHRPAGHITLRASKVLAYSQWNGSLYRSLFDSADGVRGFLDASQTELVLLQPAGQPPHIPQLRSALERSPLEWADVTDAKSPVGTRVYRRLGPLPPGQPSIRIDLTRKLGRFVELKP